MCNPRRVLVNLRQVVQEAWRTTVEQTARAEGEAAEIGRVTVELRLDAELGDLALAMLERLLRGDFADCEPWARDDAGNYRRDLDDVTLVYQPGDRHLTVEARLAERVGVEARAAAEASGFTVGEVTAEAAGRYYEDNWGGYNEARARRVAEAEAETRLAAAVDQLHRQQNAAALAAAADVARASATEAAAVQLARARDEVRAALRQRLEAALVAANEGVQHTVNRLIGEAYRHALIQLAQDSGGRVLTDERTGSVINLELELF